MSSKSQVVYAYISMSGFANEYDILRFSSKENFEEYVDVLGLASRPNCVYHIISEVDAKRILKKNREVARSPKYSDTLERLEMRDGYVPMYFSDGDESLKAIKEWI